MLDCLDEIASGATTFPTQSCVLTHVDNDHAGLMQKAGVPVDLVFQSVAGTQAANASFGDHAGAAR